MNQLISVIHAKLHVNESISIKLVKIYMNVGEICVYFSRQLADYIVLYKRLELLVQTADLGSIGNEACSTSLVNHSMWEFSYGLPPNIYS